MSCTIIDNRVVTTRTPHRCPGCGLVWPVGTEMHRVKHVDMDTMCNDYWCPVCEAFASEYADDGEFAGWDGEIRADDPTRWVAAAQRLGMTPPRAAQEHADG